MLQTMGRPMLKARRAAPIAIISGGRTHIARATITVGSKSNECASQLEMIVFTQPMLHYCRDP